MTHRVHCVYSLTATQALYSPQNKELDRYSNRDSFDVSTIIFDCLCDFIIGFQKWRTWGKMLMFGQEDKRISNRGV